MENDKDKPQEGINYRKVQRELGTHLPCLQSSSKIHTRGAEPRFIGEISEEDTLFTLPCPTFSL